MDKPEYERLRQDILTRLGKPEYGIDRTDPVNESAKELARLFSAYQSSRMKERYKKESETKQQTLNETEQRQVVKTYKLSPAVPIELSETDLQPFSKLEREVLTDYFRNTNLTPQELERPNISRQRIVALMRSGPFTVLAAKVFDYLMSLEVRNACLKAVREGDKRIIERFAEQTGVLKNQEMNLNINKPIEDATLLSKLKELGDNVA